MEEQKEQLKISKLKNLRTYSSDMVEAVRTNEMSVIKIALAEKNRQEQEAVYKKAEGTKTSKVLFAIGGLILIGLAVWGSSYVLEKKKISDNAIINKNQKVETFINYDNSYFVDITNATNVVGIVSAINSKRIEKEEGISAIFFTKKNEDITTAVSKDDFLSVLKVTAPSSLVRSLSEDFLLGEYLKKESVGKETSVFLIFGINNYNLAYASMLDWEKSMLQDLFVLFNIKISDSDNSLFEKSWRDIIINNKDARVLYGENGEGVLFYSFINKNNLIITSNSETFKEIISQVLIKNG